MYYLLVALCCITASLTAMEKPVVTWAIHNVLLQAHSPADILPRCLQLESLDPKKLEKELLSAIATNTSYTNKHAAQQPGTSLPLAMKAWLLDHENGDSMKKIARSTLSRWKNPILYHVAGAAFSPETAASHLMPIATTVALAQACKDKGLTIALASNWNTESFAAVEKQHKDVISLYKHTFLSGKRKRLTMDPCFFKDIQDELGHNRPYYYIDVTDGTGTESLEAARQAGITPITMTTLDTLEADLKKLKILE